MGLREGKKQGEGRNAEEEKEIEERKVNGRLFSQVLFPVRTHQLSLSALNMPRATPYLPV